MFDLTEGGVCLVFDQEEEEEEEEEENFTSISPSASGGVVRHLCLCQCLGNCMPSDASTLYTHTIPFIKGCHHYNRSPLQHSQYTEIHSCFDLFNIIFIYYVCIYLYIYIYILRPVQ